MLLPVDLREWVPDDDMVHFVIGAVEEMDLREAQVNVRGTGSAQYAPAMMTVLLIYCYAQGIFSSRKIERASYPDVAVRYLSGDTHADHDTIATLRRRNRKLFEQCFVQVLEMASEVGVLQVGTVSIDGTKVGANANKYKSVSYERCEELLKQLEQEVGEVGQLVKQAEQVDREQSDRGDRLAEQLRGPKKLKRKLERAKAVLEERARAKAAAQQQAYEAKVKARKKRRGRRKGCHIKPPSQEPQRTDQVNLTDEDSRLMRASKSSAYIHGYNAQAVVDAEGSQMVLGARVYCSMSREREHHRGRYDFKAPKKRKPLVLKERRRQAMAKRMASEPARKIYRKRQQTVEPVFGIIKEVLGFGRFHLRGLPKVETEWKLVCLSYNLKRLFKLIGNEPAIMMA